MLLADDQLVSLVGELIAGRLSRVVPLRRSCGDGRVRGRVVGGLGHVARLDSLVALHGAVLLTLGQEVVSLCNCLCVVLD